MVVNQVRHAIVAISHDDILRQNLGMSRPGSPQIVQVGPTIPGTGGRRVAMVQGFARR
jgi:hypothetical protein